MTWFACRSLHDAARTLTCAALAATTLLAVPRADLAAQPLVELRGTATALTNNPASTALLAGAFTFSFLLPQSPTPTLFDSWWFDLAPVTAQLTQNGASSATTGLLEFYDADVDGGFAFVTGPGVLFFLDGPTLFSGTTAAPTLEAGSYEATFNYSDAEANVGAFTISAAITAPVTTTPEPGTWALLGTGLLAIGGVAARRRRTRI